MAFYGPTHHRAHARQFLRSCQILESRDEASGRRAIIRRTASRCSAGTAKRVTPSCLATSKTMAKLTVAGLVSIFCSVLLATPITSAASSRVKPD